MTKKRLDLLIEEARSEIQNDNRFRLSPWTKVGIYDHLIDPDRDFLKELHLAKAQHIPESILLSDGMKRYVYLGLLVVDKIFPIWDRDMKDFVSKDVNASSWDPLPYIMHKATLEMLDGNQVDDGFVNEEWDFLDVPYWWDNLGNVSEEVVYSQYHALMAIYSLNYVVNGYLPYNFKYSNLSFNHDVLDEEMDDQNHNFDFIHHALQAFAYQDPNSPGWDAVRTESIKFLPDKALEFWDWLLNEAIQSTSELDVGLINWTIFEKEKYHDLFSHDNY